MSKLLKLLIAVVVVFLLGVAALFVAFPPGGGQTRDYSDATLHRDALMTIKMSQGGVPPMDMLEDPMWARTQDPGYLRALEAHMAQMGVVPNPGG